MQRCPHHPQPTPSHATTAQILRYLQQQQQQQQHAAHAAIATPRSSNPPGHEALRLRHRAARTNPVAQNEKNCAWATSLPSTTTPPHGAKALVARREAHADACHPPATHADTCYPPSYPCSTTRTNTTYFHPASPIPPPLVHSDDPTSDTCSDNDDSIETRRGSESELPVVLVLDKTLSLECALLDAVVVHHAHCSPATSPLFFAKAHVEQQRKMGPLRGAAARSAFDLSNALDTDVEEDFDEADDVEEEEDERCGPRREILSPTPKSGVQWLAVQELLARY
ncbi:hypothetical protein HDU98_002340 [Podochytrium sp. JEL0797]|nr:hypothetical protein HDU98_002340 [Podochytrium sp. JEL0797]